MAEEAYSNIRNDNLLGPMVGARVLEVTQHDPDEWQEDRQSYFCLHFDNGYTLKVVVDEAPFIISPPGAILGEVHDSDEEDDADGAGGKV